MRETETSEEGAREWEARSEAEGDAAFSHQEAALRATLDAEQIALLDSVTVHHEAEVAAKDSVIGEQRVQLTLARAEAAAFERLADEERTLGDRWQAAWEAEHRVTELLEEKLRPSLLRELAIGVPALSACVLAGALQSEASDKALVGGICAGGYAGSRWLSRR